MNIFEIKKLIHSIIAQLDTTDFDHFIIIMDYIAVGLL